MSEDLDAVTPAPLICDLPVDLCALVAEFRWQSDWALQTCISANHYLGSRERVRRMLGVTNEELSQMLYLFGPNDCQQYMAKFEEWKKSPEMPMVLISSKGTFMSFGYPCMNKKLFYDGQVTVKPLDESYWQTNFGSGSDSDSVNPWIMLSKPSENPVRLKNIRDMTEVQFRMDGLKALVPGQSAVIQWFDEDGTDMFIHPIDPITHELRDKIVHPKPKGWNQLGRVLPFNEHGHPQDLALNQDYQHCIRDAVSNTKGEPFKCDSPQFTEDYKLALSWLHNTLFITDTQTGRQISHMDFPFSIRFTLLSPDLTLIAVATKGHGSFILDMTHGQLIPVEKFFNFGNVGRVLKGEYKISIDQIDCDSETVIHPSRILLNVNSIFIRRNLFKFKDMEKLLMMEWKDQKKNRH